jgi:hypothetical protein
MQGELKYFYNRLIPFRFAQDEEQSVLSLSLDITEQHAIRKNLSSGRNSIGGLLIR